MLACYLQLKMKSKTECFFLDEQIICEDKHLLLLSTVNLPLLEHIRILTAFYKLPVLYF